MINPVNPVPLLLPLFALVIEFPARGGSNEDYSRISNTDRFSSTRLHLFN